DRLARHPRRQEERDLLHRRRRRGRRRGDVSAARHSAVGGIAAPGGVITSTPGGGSKWKVASGTSTFRAMSENVSVVTLPKGSVTAASTMSKVARSTPNASAPTSSEAFFAVRPT